MEHSRKEQNDWWENLRISATIIGGSEYMSKTVEVKKEPIGFGVTTNEAREHLSEIIGAASYGDEWIPLTRRGNLVAVIVPKRDIAHIANLEKLDKKYKITTVEAREHFADVVNMAAYGSTPVVITRNGKMMACVVSVEIISKLSTKLESGEHRQERRSWKSILKEKYGESGRPAVAKKRRHDREPSC
jgi:prevent-host-death family protein